jgi:hypothetical protein
MAPPVWAAKYSSAGGHVNRERAHPYYFSSKKPAQHHGGAKIGRRVLTTVLIHGFLLPYTPKTSKQDETP